MNKKKITCLVPAWNESDVLQLFYGELTKVLESEKDYDWSILFINDGSTDSTEEQILEFANKDSRVELISLSRNFGQQAAITAGLDQVESDAVIIMDVDLQDPPSVIPDLLESWKNGNEVVYAVRKSRDTDSFFKKGSASLFYWLLNKLSDIPIPKNTGDFRLLDAKVVVELRKFGEHARFMRGLSIYVGFNQACVLFDRPERAAGKTKYPFMRLLRLSVDSITGFSTVPLKMIGNIGFIVSALSFVGIIYAFTAGLFFSEYTVPGWASTAISILFMGGIQLIMLGIIGTYIARIYDDVRNRPLYIVSRTHKKR